MLCFRGEFALIARMMRSHSSAFRARSRRLVSWPLLLASVMAVVPLLAAAPLLSAGAGGVLLLGYVAVFIAAGSLLVSHRDVT